MCSEVAKFENMPRAGDFNFNFFFFPLCVYLSVSYDFDCKVKSSRLESMSITLRRCSRIYVPNCMECQLG